MRLYWYLMFACFVVAVQAKQNEQNIKDPEVEKELVDASSQNATRELVAYDLHGAVYDEEALYNVRPFFLDLPTKEAEVACLCDISADEALAYIVHISSGDLSSKTFVKKPYWQFIADLHMLASQMPSYGEFARCVLRRLYGIPEFVAGVEEYVLYLNRFDPRNPTKKWFVFNERGFSD